MLWKIRATLLSSKMCINVTEICHTLGISSIWCVASVSEQSFIDMQLWNKIFSCVYTFVIRFPQSCTYTTHMHTHTTHVPTNMHTHTNMHAHTWWIYLQHTSINIILTDVKQDGSETGHSQKKNDYYQNNTDCSHSWSLISALWTRPCGMVSK